MFPWGWKEEDPVLEGRDFWLAGVSIWVAHRRGAEDKSRPLLVPLDEEGVNMPQQAARCK